MLIVGSYDTSGNFLKFKQSFEVTKVENFLISKSDGYIVAIKNEFGQWVDYKLNEFGIKIIYKVINK